MEDCLQHTSPSGVDILPGDKLSDLDYADDNVLLFDNLSDAQMLVDRIVLSAAPFSTQFAPLECKVLMQDLNVVDPLYLNGTQLEVVDSFVYLGSTVSKRWD